MRDNIRYKGNINNTSAIIFFNGGLVLFHGFFPRPSILLRGPSYPIKSKTSDVIVMVGVSKWQNRQISIVNLPHG